MSSVTIIHLSVSIIGIIDLFVFDSMQPEQIGRLWNLAEQLTAERLGRICLKHMAAHFEAVFSDQTFLTRLQPDSLQRILSIRPTTEVSSASKLKAIVLCVGKEPAERSPHFEQLLRTVDLSTVPSGFEAELLADSDRYPLPPACV